MNNNVYAYTHANIHLRSLWMLKWMKSKRQSKSTTTEKRKQSRLKYFERKNTVQSRAERDTETILHRTKLNNRIKRANECAGIHTHTHTEKEKRFFFYETQLNRLDIRTT